MTLDARDRIDIIDVQHLYGHVLDRGLWSRLGNVFTPDGVFDPSDVGLPAMRGMEAIREKLIPLEERSPLRCHHATDILIRPVSANEAEVASKYVCNHATGIVSFGEYHDRMVRTGKGWRIAERKTRRRALGVGDGGSSKFEIDWDALIAGAAERPPLIDTPAIDLSLEDRVALLDLQHLYGHVLDRGLWSRIGEVFAPDGVFDPSNVGLPAMHGLDEIREKLIPLEEEAGPTRCHHSTNAVILEAVGDRARMLSKYICSSAKSAITYGEYEDDMVRTPDGWRIARRTTLRRAAGVPDDDPSPFTIAWDALLGSAPPRPDLSPSPAPRLSVDDRLDIEDLLTRYAHVVDHWQIDRLGTVFTADVVIEPTYGGLAPVSGIDRLRRAFFPESADHPRDLERAHQTTNVTVLDATEDTARVLGKYLAWHKTAAVVFGEYEDDLVRTADGWRIRHRKVFRRAFGLDEGLPTGAPAQATATGATAQA